MTNERKISSLNDGIESILTEIIGLTQAIDERDIMKAWARRTAYDIQLRHVEEKFNYYKMFKGELIDHREKVLVFDRTPYDNVVNRLIKKYRNELR